MASASFAPLRNRDFRTIWAGNFISLIGSQMTTATLVYHAYELSHDSRISGLLGLCRALPILFFAAFGGVLADSLDRRRTVILTKTVFTAISALLALLTLTGKIHVGWLFGLMSLSA